MKSVCTDRLRCCYCSSALLKEFCIRCVKEFGSWIFALGGAWEGMEFNVFNIKAAMCTMNTTCLGGI